MIDAAILVAAARGRSSGAVLAAARAAKLVTTDRVVQETRRRIELGLRRPELLPIVDALVAETTVVPVAALEMLHRTRTTSAAVFIAAAATCAAPGFDFSMPEGKPAT